MPTKWTRCLSVPIPNTCFLTELSLLSEISSFIARLNPTVVEFGTLLGGSTAAIASGLFGRGTVHTYDCFKFQDWMRHLSPDFKDMKAGDSFREIAEKNICQLYNNVKLYTANLLGYQEWDQPIDMLVIDAFKEIQIAEVTLPTFIPYLKEGAYLFDQDIGYNPVQFSYMVIFYHMLRGYLIPTYLPWQGTGLMFQVSKPIPIDLVNHVIADRFNNYANNLIEAYQHFYAMGVFDPKRTNACIRKNELFEASPFKNDKKFVSNQYDNSGRKEDSDCDTTENGV